MLGRLTGEWLLLLFWGNEERRRNPTSRCAPSLDATDTSGAFRVTAPLSPDQWQQLESLVDALLDTPPERRAALFAKVSGGDPVRREELERLVAACERTYPLLDQPAAERFAALVETAPLQPLQVVADRYRITREIGRGGMATVYLAHDLKHSRDVALKVVRSELVATVGSGRFLREIEIASQLRHPHIVPLYDSGRVPADPSAGDERSRDETLYYVMPYEAGPSLRERLRREGRLSVDDTLVILRDVCDALAYAHQRGIVHRDIKPDNVLLSGRHALVADFGVARAATEATGTGPSTGAGVMLGTPAYMAPEQVAADPRVDHRADIYAVGVLAYELLTGRTPFGADSPQDILAAHLTQPPEPITARRPDLPLTVAELVMRCLEKSPAHRYQSADEMLAQLQSLAIATTPTEPARRPTGDRPAVGPGSGDEAATNHSRKLSASSIPDVRWWWTRWTVVGGLVATVSVAAWLSRSPNRVTLPPLPGVAVLVFQHGNNAELEALAIGLTSSLIAALGDVPRLQVRSFEAVLPYRDGRSQVSAIGRTLQVRWLVGGTVIRLADRVVVSADLIDAATGGHIARREASASPGTESKLIEQLVSTVSTMLREHVGDQIRLEGWRAGTRVEEAFDGVNRAHKSALDANFLAEAGDLPGAWLSLRRADSALARAAHADPRWVEPLIQRAWNARKIALMLFGTGTSPDSMVAVIQRGIEYGQAARRLRPKDPRALEAHGMLLFTDWQLRPPNRSDSALAQTQRILTDASDADTSLARALNAVSAIHFQRGNFEQARLALARSYAADAYAEDPRGVFGRLFTYNFVDNEDREARRWCAAYGDRFAPDWFAGACRLQLMAWDSTETPTADSAWRIAHNAAAAAPELIRDAVSAQLDVLVAGVLARMGARDSARRVLDDIASRVNANPSLAREPASSTLLELEAAARVRLGETETAITLLTSYLKRRPDRRTALARDRRFRDLPITGLVDAAAQPR
jgi:eukaryotic-like serine/threonine-protein kinase